MMLPHPVAAAGLALATLLVAENCLASESDLSRADVDAPLQADKSRYTLVDPTPPGLMRDMSTDRPDTTESPISVDAGHFQLEFDAVNVAKDLGVTDVAVGVANLKLGLTHFMDAQLVIEPLHRSDGQTGMGDVTLRDKINLWGNEGGATAFALMPFVVLPLGSDEFSTGFVEGGLIAPLGVEGRGGFSFGFMLELDAVRRADAYGADLVATGTAGHDLWGDLAGFLELASTVPLDSDPPVALSANSGLTYGFTDDAVADAGLRVGLTDAAEDISVFLGGSARY